MKVFRTRNQGVAACLRYALGDSAHIATILEKPRGVTFLFEGDHDACRTIANAYFKDHGEVGFAVTDSKTLLDCFIGIRKTLSEAITNGGEWRNEACMQLA